MSINYAITVHHRNHITWLGQFSASQNLLSVSVLCLCFSVCPTFVSGPLFFKKYLKNLSGLKVPPDLRVPQPWSENIWLKSRSHYQRNLLKSWVIWNQYDLKGMEHLEKLISFSKSDLLMVQKHVFVQHTNSVCNFKNLISSMLIIKGKVCTVQKSLIIKTVTEKYFTFSTCIIFVYNKNVNLGFLNMNRYKKKTWYDTSE